MGYNEALEALKEDGRVIIKNYLDLDRAITSQDLTAAQLSYTTSIADKFKVHSVLAHNTAALADKSLSVSFNSLDGANYDTVIGYEAFDGGTDIAFVADDNLRGVVCESGDEITLTTAGATNLGTLYCTIIYEVLA